jgi:hypothetical protein
MARYFQLFLYPSCWLPHLQLAGSTVLWAEGFLREEQHHLKREEISLGSGLPLMSQSTLPDIVSNEFSLENTASTVPPLLVTGGMTPTSSSSLCFLLRCSRMVSQFENAVSQVGNGQASELVGDSLSRVIEPNLLVKRCHLPSCVFNA